MRVRAASTGWSWAEQRDAALAWPLRPRADAFAMPGGAVATVEVESVDNMATLPVSRAHDVTAEKNNVTNKEMELKNVRPQPLKRTSLFIIMSFIYAKLLVVICIAYVISEVVTHKLPLHYYEACLMSTHKYNTHFTPDRTSDLCLGSQE
ncbi:hypothetical protein C0J52_11241 [Blattella germanica]|nr:hypothetical protein C0J52_11241 [Blattella germanica]